MFKRAYSGYEAPEDFYCTDCAAEGGEIVVPFEPLFWKHPERKQLRNGWEFRCSDCNRRGNISELHAHLTPFGRCSAQILAVSRQTGQVIEAMFSKMCGASQEEPVWPQDMETPAEVLAVGYRVFLNNVGEFIAAHVKREAEFSVKLPPQLNVNFPIGKPSLLLNYVLGTSTPPGVQPLVAQPALPLHRIQVELEGAVWDHDQFKTALSAFSTKFIALRLTSRFAMVDYRNFEDAIEIYKMLGQRIGDGTEKAPLTWITYITW